MLITIAGIQIEKVRYTYKFKGRLSIFSRYSVIKWRGANLETFEQLMNRKIIFGQAVFDILLKLK